MVNERFDHVLAMASGARVFERSRDQTYMVIDIPKHLLGVNDEIRHFPHGRLEIHRGEFEESPEERRDTHTAAPLIGRHGYLQQDEKIWVIVRPCYLIERNISSTSSVTRATGWE